MQKTYKPETDMWALDTDDAHILHRTGSGDYTEIHHARVTAADLPAWEEIPLAEARAHTVARAAEAAYKSRVIALIRARYDADDETAILRQRDSKPDEFAAYNAYVEDCKARVKAEMEAERVAEDGAENIKTEEDGD